MRDRAHPVALETPLSQMGPIRAGLSPHRARGIRVSGATTPDRIQGDAATPPAWHNQPPGVLPRLSPPHRRGQRSALPTAPPPTPTRENPLDPTTHIQG